MEDDKIDRLLADWSNAKIPEPKKGDKILRNTLFENELRLARSRKKRRASILALVFGGAAIILLIAFAKLPRQSILTPIELSTAPPAAEASEKSEDIRFSLLVLERNDDESAVEILEDTILTAKDQNVYERSIGGRKLFFWFLALEPSVFSLDIGIDNAVETGIVAVPDKTKAVHLTADGRRFDVFVSIL